MSEAGTVTAKGARRRRDLGVVALLGSTGFIGTALATHLATKQVRVCQVKAPRLDWPRDTPVQPDGSVADLAPDVVDALARSFDGVDVVINAAGVAQATAQVSPALYGANGLLPLVIARACALARVRRFIHLSSAAVQAEGVLDETDRCVAHTPYARSRVLGERLLLGFDGVETVVFRPTSVHGPRREMTRSLVRFASSPVSLVAGDGSAPTPQVLVAEVAACVAHVASAIETVPPIVLQPHNGMTTGSLLRILGNREPRHLTSPVARVLHRGVLAAGKHSARAAAYANRMDVLLFGRRQVPGWLAENGWVTALRPDLWADLRAQCGGRSDDGGEPRD